MMKKIFTKTVTLIICAVSAFCLGSCEAVHTISKTLDDVGKILGSPTAPKRMSVEITGQEPIENGKKFMFEFTVTNYGEDIKEYHLHTGDNSTVHDNLGNQARIESIRFGNRYGTVNTVSNALPGNIKLKVTVIISGFSSRAKTFDMIKIHGNTYPSSASDGDFIFRNIPILSD